ncbi:amino acid/polyamine transporter I [Penicillium odoratum]|uniref:amino acid/polyamine transporter I n=1 Tax=Penicillium odoratum TaxID=1167516 RepID=UPI0025475F76|nr:amino acid/polyamine transporter I [Penicillium odoratum]KAJ5752125.1 amino acid/polyamine transporter I [Penicillium odoratum]
MAAVLMATWEALSSTMVSGLVSGGPVSLLYGFILAFLGAVSTAASLGELTSMYPTAGGQYHFIAKLAPDHWQYPLSWFTGWVANFGWISFTASAPFLAATMIQGLIILNDAQYNFERWHGNLLYWAFVLFASAINLWGTRLMTLVEHVSLVIHVVAFVVIIVVMWVYVPARHSASFVFTHFANNSGWSSSGLSWCLGMLSSCYVLAGYDGAIHLCEEMQTPETSVPWCMLGSLAINGLLGFVFLLTILFCMGDMQAALNTETGYPIIEIFYSITGNKAAATAMTCVLILMAVLATIPLMASTSRMLWCLARDKAFPFSRYLSKIGEKRQVPDYSVLTVTVLLLLLGLINIGSTTAFNAIISLAVFGLHLSYLLPIALILWRRLSTPKLLTYGPWKLGGCGVILNILSLVYLSFTCIFMLFPPYYPVTAANMNYASLIFGAVAIFSLIYWVWRGRKVYEGPVMENHIH